MLAFAICESIRHAAPAGGAAEDAGAAAAERTPAREYVDRLLATAATQPADLEKLIRDDASITPLPKLEALEAVLPPPRSRSPRSLAYLPKLSGQLLLGQRAGLMEGNHILRETDFLEREHKARGADSGHAKPRAGWTFS